MIKERYKSNPLPPSPSPYDDVSNTLNSENGDSDLEDIRNGEDKMDEQIEESSPDREQNKQDKERESGRYERERKQEDTRRERKREHKNKEVDCRYKTRVTVWESRERDKKNECKQDNKEEKEREYKRKQDVLDQKLEGDDDIDSRKRKRKRRKRRMREKDKDLSDRLVEEERQLAEVKRKAEKEFWKLTRREKDEQTLPVSGNNRSDKELLDNRINAELKDEDVEMTCDGDLSNEKHIRNDVLQNGDYNTLSKKLGLGLVGKRIAVLSAFNQDKEKNSHNDRKMRHFIPIDCSTEESQAVQSPTPGSATSNLAAPADFARKISGDKIQEKTEVETESSKRLHDRCSHNDKDGEESVCTRDENCNKKTLDYNQNLIYAKQLKDMIPKTKEELFSYGINWDVCDKTEVHDGMRPWISEKISAILGDEELTLVDYIVSSIHEHLKASEMLYRLECILADEAEIFVLEMWRMLISEIKKGSLA